MTDSKYDSIINLPHKQSQTRAHMALADRAAQFAPFAALSGYDEAILETGRVTGERLELSEDMQAELNAKLALIKANLGQNNEHSFTFFVPDAKKSGGAYITKSGTVKRLDYYKRQIVLTDGAIIPMDEMLSIDGEGSFLSEQ